MSHMLEPFAYHFPFFVDEAPLFSFFYLGSVSYKTFVCSTLKKSEHWDGYFVFHWDNKFPGFIHKAPQLFLFDWGKAIISKNLGIPEFEINDHLAFFIYVSPIFVLVNWCQSRIERTRFVISRLDYPLPFFVNETKFFFASRISQR